MKSGAPGEIRTLDPRFTNSGSVWEGRDRQVDEGFAAKRAACARLPLILGSCDDSRMALLEDAADTVVGWFVHAIPIPAVKALLIRWAWEPRNRREDERIRRLEDRCVALVKGRRHGEAFGLYQRETVRLLRDSSNRPDKYVPPMTADEMEKEKERSGGGALRTMTFSMDFSGAPARREIPFRDTSLWRALSDFAQSKCPDTDGTLDELTANDVGCRIRGVERHVGFQKYEMRPMEFRIKRFLMAVAYLSWEGLPDSYGPK